MPVWILTTMPPEDILADLQAAARYAVTRAGDPETLRRIRARAECVREEIRREQGETERAASLVREIRDEG